jgi:serine protease Do
LRYTCLGLTAALATSFFLNAQQSQAPAAPRPQKMDILKQLSASFEEVTERSGRAVVQIFVRSYVTGDETTSNGELLTAQNSSGSGIILTSDGYILTNAHVVKGAHSVKVQLNNTLEAQARRNGDHTMSRPISGRIVGVDRDTDLAVIKIEKQNLPFLSFGNSDDLKQGEIVLAVGNPLGLDNSVSMGVVSAVSRQVKSDDPMVYIQTDAPINPGNSGGPLIDTDGNVVGLNTFILTQSGGSEGIGFAIPSKIAEPVYQQLKTQGHVHRAQLGLVGQTITPEMAEGLSLETDHGVIVSDTEPDGPAATGGVEADDIITALDGRNITSQQQLEARVFRLKPGTKVSLQIQRGDTSLTVPILTEEQPGAELDALADLVDPVQNVIDSLAIVGLNLTPQVIKLMPDLRRPAGVVVAARKANAPFSGPPLEVGDVIYSVNRQTVSSIDQLRNMLAKIKSGEAAVLLVERDGHLIYIPLQSD